MEESEDEFLQWAEKNPDWHVMGHILNRPGRFSVFHEQVVILNLDNIHEVNFSTVDGDAYPKYEQSELHVHDDYTPLWVQGIGGWFDYEDIEQEMNNFFDYSSHCLEEGYKIVNVPDNIRSAKFCVYPEDDVEQTLYWLTDPNSCKKLRGKISTNLIRLVINGCFMNLNMSNEILYVTNTEEFPMKMK